MQLLHGKDDEDDVNLLVLSTNKPLRNTSPAPSDYSGFNHQPSPGHSATTMMDSPELMDQPLSLLFSDTSDSAPLSDVSESPLLDQGTNWAAAHALRASDAAKLAYACMFEVQPQPQPESMTLLCMQASHTARWSRSYPQWHYPAALCSHASPSRCPQRRGLSSPAD